MGNVGDDPRVNEINGDNFVFIDGLVSSFDNRDVLTFIPW